MLFRGEWHTCLDGVSRPTIEACAAGTDGQVHDCMSLLGRDILDHFDLILGRQRQEILLLLPNHSYKVV